MAGIEDSFSSGRSATPGKRHTWHALIGRDITRQFEMQVDGVTGLVRFLKET